MGSAARLIILLQLFFVMAAAFVSAAQPALPTTLYGRVTYSNSSPAEGLTVIASWIDNNGVQRASIARTLTSEEASALGQPEFAGYYFFNQGSLLAQQSSFISVIADKAVNEEQVESKPGGEPVLAPSLLLPDYNDKTPPSIASVQFNQYDATVSFNTDELATSTVRYGTEVPTGSAFNNSLTIAHKVLLPGLKGFTTYKFEAIATDVSGNAKIDNNNGAYYEFTTGAPLPPAPTPNVPGSKPSSSKVESSGSLQDQDQGNFPPTAPRPDPNTLPTSVYGQLADEEGNPIEDSEVTAQWTDSSGTHELTATTLDEEEAEKLGNPELAGYYFFSRNLTLPPGITINISSKKHKSYSAAAISNPGGSSQAAVIRTYAAQTPNLPPEREARQAEPDSVVLKPEVERKTDYGRRFRGIISFLLLLAVILLAIFSFRLYLSKPRATSAEKKLHQAIRGAINARARDIMTRNVITANIEDTLLESINTLLRKDVEGVVVLRNNIPIGWLMEETIVKEALVRNRELSLKLKDAALLPLSPIKPDLTIFGAAKVLLASKHGKGAVMEGSRLIGVVTLTDVSKAIDEFYSRHVIESESLPGVSAIMSEDVLLMDKKSTIAGVAERMDNEGVDYAILETEPESIITARDIMGELYNNAARTAKSPASYAAKAPIKSMQPFTNAFEANRIMLKSFKRIPVLRQGKVKGILSQEDVVKALLDYLQRISSLLEKGGHINVEEK